MSRGLPTAYTDKAQATVVRSAWLIEIATKTTPFKWTNHESDIIFPSTGGSTFTSRPYSQGSIRVTTDNDGQIEIFVPDKTGALKANNTDWSRKRATIYRLHRDLLGSDTYAQRDVYYILKTASRPDGFTFVLNALLMALEEKRPYIRATRRNFPGIAIE